MTTLTLLGCRTEPLGSYLKALGVLRLVAEQTGGEVAGAWDGEHFRLSTPLDRQQLTDFFLQRYEPTPLVAPWNGGSGFDGRSAGIADIEQSELPRLEPYRRTIAAARAIHAQWLAEPATMKEKDRKRVLIERCRNRLPDQVLDWIDAVVVLTDDSSTYPPLLGTGGNLGRLELSITFMQRLVEALCLSHKRGAPTVERSEEWLSAALFAEGHPRHVRASFGQFDPGRAGGMLSSPLEALDKEGFVNPWDFVLLVEGALLFASAAARRLAAGASRASLPFMVMEPLPIGYATGTEGETVKGELWAPVWSAAASYAEIASLLGEGRAEWSRRQARSTLDLARAAGSLGVDRGITEFVRHSFLERNGQSILAVPVGRIPVSNQRRRSVLGTASLDHWLERIRRASNRPVAVAVALRRLDEALFTMARVPNLRSIMATLIGVADLERTVSRSTTFREKGGISPAPLLRASDWFADVKPDDADDEIGRAELSLAVALASGRDLVGKNAKAVPSLRPLLQAVRFEGSHFAWADAPAVPGLTDAPLDDVLARTLARRAIDATRQAKERNQDDAREVQDGEERPSPAFDRAIPASMSDMAMLFAGELNDRRIGRLLAALLMLDWRGDGVDWPTGPETTAEPSDPVWRLLAPFFHSKEVRAWNTPGRRLTPERTWSTLLIADRIDDVVRSACWRLRCAGLQPAVGGASTVVPGRRIAASLLVPLQGHSVGRLLERVAVRPKNKETEEG